MKRSKSIHLKRRRSYQPQTDIPWGFKPIALGLAAVSIVGCDNRRDSMIYHSIYHCQKNNPGLEQACQTAYQCALDKAEKTSPKYQTLQDCDSDFHDDDCIPYTLSNGQNGYMPAMRAFVMSKVPDSIHDYDCEPLFSPDPDSPGYMGSWASASGKKYPKRYGHQKLEPDIFKPKHRVTYTLARGGFGHIMRSHSVKTSSTSKGWGG